MMQDNLIELKKPEAEFQDPLTEILRKGARQLLAQALEAEVALFMEQFAEATDEKGRKRVVRNGYLPERQVQTGIGPVPAKVPRVRDREKGHAGKVRFKSSILPPYLRKTRSMEQLIPWLYAVADRTPRVYPWMNEPGGGILAAWNIPDPLTAYTICDTM